MGTEEGSGGLTERGYWALLQSAGIQKIRLMSDGENWLAMNRNRTILPVPDPGGFEPAQRRDIADSVITGNEDS